MRENRDGKGSENNTGTKQSRTCGKKNNELRKLNNMNGELLHERHKVEYKLNNTSQVVRRKTNEIIHT